MATGEGIDFSQSKEKKGKLQKQLLFNGGEKGERLGKEQDEGKRQTGGTYWNLDIVKNYEVLDITPPPTAADRS